MSSLTKTRIWNTLCSTILIAISVAPLVLAILHNAPLWAILPLAGLAIFATALYIALLTLLWTDFTL